MFSLDSPPAQNAIQPRDQPYQPPRGDDPAQDRAKDADDDDLVLAVGARRECALREIDRRIAERISRQQPHCRKRQGRHGERAGKSAHRGNTGRDGQCKQNRCDRGDRAPAGQDAHDAPEKTVRGLVARRAQ